MRQLNGQYINIVLEQTAPEATALGEAKKKYILENMNIDVREEFKERYADLILKHHYMISQHKHKLDRCKTMFYDIILRSNEPIYIKQFKIQDAHQKEVANHVKQWLSGSCNPLGTSTIQVSLWCLRNMEVSELCKTS